MTNYIKKNQTLPQFVYENFEGIVDSEIRDSYIYELRRAGWTLEAIANASHLTRERVRQLSKNTGIVTSLSIEYEVPEPPIKPEKPKPVYVEPSPDTLARLLELQPYAQQVRSNGSKYREEAEEYTELLDYAHRVEGVTLYRLAKRLGITHGAIRFRLVRYGYKDPITATSKVYTPILAENRISTKTPATAGASK